MRGRIPDHEKPVVPPPVRAAVTDTLTPENLDAEHLQFLTTALSKILSTEVAEFTFAQIIDGYPTFHSFTEFNWVPPGDNWPVRAHVDLCEGATGEYRAFWSSFDLLSLKFEPKALQDFQNQVPGSRVFNLRLLELVAVACHQVATLLFQPERNRHQKEYDKWVTEQHRLKAAGHKEYRFLDVAPPVPFYHHWYVDYEQYPRGIHDIVGYWAEAKILGGVVLFDRGESGTECREVFFHAGLRCGPTTIFPPTHDQLEDIIAFLTLVTDTRPTPCPLPILATERNRPRWHRYHATKYFNIFRNKYDSRLPSYFVWPDKFPAAIFQSSTMSIGSSTTRFKQRTTALSWIRSGSPKYRKE